MGKMLAVIVAIVLSIFGCEKPVPAPPPSAVVLEFQQLLGKKQKLTFLSYDGKWIGFDGDADITFSDGNRVHLTRYSIGVVHYVGTYEISESGRVLLSLANREWDPMQLARDEKSLILQPAADAKETSRERPWWPFRLVERAPFDEPTTQP